MSQYVKMARATTERVSRKYGDSTRAPDFDDSVTVTHTEPRPLRPMADRVRDAQIRQPFETRRSMR